MYSVNEHKSEKIENIVTFKKWPYGGIKNRTVWNANCNKLVIMDMPIRNLRKMPVEPAIVLGVGMATSGE